MARWIFATTVQGLTWFLVWIAVAPETRGAQDPVHEEVVELRIESRAHRSPRAPWVPQIGFRVTRRSEGPFGAPLGEGTTDAQGRATLKLPREALGLPTPEVSVWVHQPGYKMTQGVWLRGGQRWSQGKPACRLVVEAGTSHFLQAVDSEGQPLSAVYAWRLSGNGDTSSPREQPVVSGQPRRWLEIHLARPSPVDVWAVAPGLGSAEMLGLPWGAGDLGIRRFGLSGSGQLQGHIQDLYGRGEAGLGLFFRLAGTECRLPRFFGWKRWHLGSEFSGQGMQGGLVTTDADGGFSLGGLAPGEYEVWFSRRVRPWGDWEQLPGGLVRTGESPLSLRAPTPRLLVTLQDHRGAPWSTGAGPDRLGQDRPGRSSNPDFLGLPRWPHTPVLFVREVDPRDPNHWWDWRSLRSRTRGQDQWVCDLDPSTTYSVQVIGGPFRGQPKWITTESSLVVEPMLFQAGPEVRPEASWGSLQVLARAGKQRLPGDGRGPRFRLYVAELDSGFPLVGREPYEEGDKTFRLPAGSYRIVLEALPLLGDHHGRLVLPRSFGRVERVVTIRGGEEQILELNLAVGGRLEVAVEGAGDQADLEATRADFPSAPPEDPYLHALSQTVQLRLQRPAFPSESVLFAAPLADGSFASGTGLHEDWAFGSQNESEMLPVGSFRLFAVTRSGRSVTQDVVIRAGETTPVRVVIPPGQPRGEPR